MTPRFHLGRLEVKKWLPHGQPSSKVNFEPCYHSGNWPARQAHLIPKENSTINQNYPARLLFFNTMHGSAGSFAKTLLIGFYFQDDPSGLLVLVTQRSSLGRALRGETKTVAWETRPVLTRMDY